MSKRARCGTRWRAPAWLTLVLLVLLPRPAPAAGAEREAAIVSRALAFERSLDERIGAGSIGVAVIHKPDDTQSQRCARDWYDGFSTLANVKIQDRSVTVRNVAYSADVVGNARKSGIHVFVVCSGLTAELTEITRASRAQRVLTVGTALAHVEQSLSFGVFREQDKFQMVVNLRVASAEGVTFSSSMLKLARVIR